jgi:tetratricopeptide (TPR) repeat protein
MRYLFIILTLLLHLSLLQNAALSQVTPQTQAQNSEQNTEQLTLDQIKEKIGIYVAVKNEQNKAAIDKAIATETRRRSMSGFQLDSRTLDELRKLGAGPKTIESLKDKLQAVPETEDPCQPPGKIIVLVADFKNLDDNKSDVAVSDYILAQLGEATRNYPDTEIKPLYETISSHQGREVAIEKGREKRATIVLWGWYKQLPGHISLTVHFDPVQDIPLDLRAYQLTRVFTTLEIESFTVQMQLSKEMTYLTLLTMGMVRLLAGDYDGAIERLSRALDRGNAPSQMVNKSYLYIARGLAYQLKAYFRGDSFQSFERAVADFTQSTLLDSQDIAGYLLLGLACLQSNQLDKALDAANKAIALKPDKYQHAFALYLAAAVSASKDENDKAKQYAAREIEVLELLPHSEEKFMLLGDIYLIVNDPVRAVFSLTEAARLSICGQNKVIYAYQKGMIYAGSGNLNKAIEEFDASIKRHPDFAKAYGARGKVYFQKEDHKRAIIDYDTAIQLDTSVPDFYADRGDARLALNQWEEAISDYKKATVVDPHFALGFYKLGLAYRQRKLFHEAIDSFSRYITLEPEDFDGYQFRRELYHSAGEFDLALADANQMLRIKPDDVFTFIIRGGIYSAKGDFKRSIEDYSVYIKAKPGDQLGYRVRAWVYEKDKQLDKAIADFDFAITLKPDDASSYIYRGSAYMVAGKEDLAIADFKKVLELTKDPNLKKIAESEIEIIRLERERKALEMKMQVKPD